MSDDYDDTGDRTVSELEGIGSKLDGLESALDQILETLRESQKLLERRTDVWGILPLLFILMVFSGWGGSKLDRFTDRMWYSNIYDTKWENVLVSKRPANCDFLRSPIGGKGCEYEKKKETFGSAERQQNIQQATTPEEKARWVNEPNRVYVYWEKKED